MKVCVKLILLGLVFLSCKTGNVNVISDLPSSIDETSAIEKTVNSPILWVIQDAGNSNQLFGLNLKGKIKNVITISNGENIDWEDLTSDDIGNIYIGDFGNNDKNRREFTIYKVTHTALSKSSTNASLIHFKLPEGIKALDFESFFLYNDYFYIFSKDSKTCKLFKVPNKIGTHVASFISKVKLKGKHNKVTSADISDDGKTVVLLNHNKLWKLTNFTNDDFFSGVVEELVFDHDTQKEGVNFIENNQVLITDEKTKHEGGNIYHFSLN